MKVSTVPLLLLLFVGCSAEVSDVDTLQGVWVQVPIPRDWEDRVLTNDEYAERVSRFANVDPEMLVFKGNTVTTLAGDRTTLYPFTVGVRGNDGSVNLELVREGGPDQTMSCKFRGSVLECIRIVWGPGDKMTN